MTGPLGNIKFCFPRISMFEILEKQNSLFPSGPVIKCLLFPGWEEKKIKQLNLHSSCQPYGPILLVSNLPEILLIRCSPLYIITHQCVTIMYFLI